MNGLDDKSRMKREFHVRFCESLRGKFPWATRLMSRGFFLKAIDLLIRIGQGFTALSLLRTVLASFPAYGSSPLKAEHIRPARSFLIRGHITL
jgi:hypothetical protein